MRASDLGPSRQAGPQPQAQPISRMNPRQTESFERQQPYANQADLNQGGQAAAKNMFSLGLGSSQAHITSQQKLTGASGWLTP